MKRPGSSVPYFAQRIPVDIRPRAIGRALEVPCGEGTVKITVSPKMETIRFSLRTSIPAEVKIRQAAAAAYLEAVWIALRADAPLSLTHRQAVALSGVIYRAWADGADRERTLAITHTPTGWVLDHVTPEEEIAYFEATLAHLDAIGSKGESDVLEAPLGALVDRLLLAERIASVDQPSRSMLLQAFWKALQHGMQSRKRNAEGDYSEDPKANHYPASFTPAPPPTKPSSPPAKVTLTGLLDGWWTEAKALGRKPSTRESYGNTLKAFVAYLKHDDASRVRPEDVLGFKDFRLASVSSRTGRPISAKTVRGSDLAALSVIFGWAVANRRLPANPAEGVTLKVGKRTRLRSKGFTDAEASAILSASLKLERGNARPETFAAKRWVPWLCAYTGARVGEIAQLRKQDVRREGELWVITITPEAGTVKTDEAREVVLHAHLVDLGFTDFVKGAKAGHLFLHPADDGSVLGPLQGLKNRLAEFARTIVKDPNVAPNHGWRHRFKTVGMEAGIAPRVLDAIQGQKPRTVAETYGDVTLKTIAAAMERMPRSNA